MKNLTESDNKSIITMLENGANNSRIALKFPGITKEQIDALRELANDATEQTKSKLKRDPILVLYQMKSIEIHHLYAAEYIRYAFQKITRDVEGKTMSFKPYVDLFHVANDHDESKLAMRLHKQYVAWCEECRKKNIKVSPIIHVLTEPVTLRETDGHFGFRYGMARDYLVKGLSLYVDMFGIGKKI